MSRHIPPTTFFPKPPLKNRDYAIYYNLDLSLKHIDHHRHTYYEFYFLISGNVSYTIDGVKYNLRSGDCLLISPGQFHHADIDSCSQTYERYVLWLQPDYIQRLSSPVTNLLLPFQKVNFSRSYLHLPKEIQLIITNLLQMILIQSHSQEYGADLLVSSYITEILIHVGKIKLYQQPVYFEKDLDNNDIMLNALNYITDHIHEPLTIGQIAEALFISSSHLSKIFSGYMGLPLHQYIVKKKLYLARQDLLSGISIEQLCTTYGFGNYSTFFRAFKKEFGMSPRTLSKELKK